MAASNEWTVYHLTPEGWIEGDKQRDFAPLVRQPIPESRVLSVVYKETGSGYGPVNCSQQQQWQSTDVVLLEELLNKYGPPPKEL